MRIIIAPAKKMIVDTDSFAVEGLPPFLEQTEQLKAVLQAMSPKELQSLWKCSDAIAKQNIFAGCIFRSEVGGAGKTAAFSVL